MPAALTSSVRLSAREAVRQACERRGVTPATWLGKVTPAVEAARAANHTDCSRGELRCGKVWRGQRKEQMPTREDSLPVFVSKGKGQIGNALSPFNRDVPGCMMAWATADGEPGSVPLPLPQKLELVWQAAKLAIGEGWSEYFARRAKIYAARVPKRRYIDREVGIAGACFGSRSAGLVQYVPSRVFYCHAYERSVLETPEFQFLQDLVDDGFNLLLMGPDGHPLELGEQAVASAYQDPSLQFGHERVLLAMLRQVRPWAEQPRCWPGAGGMSVAEPAKTPSANTDDSGTAALIDSDAKRQRR